MEPNLKLFLQKNNISYIEHFHAPVFTVEESKKQKIRMPTVFHTKNLFLKDESKNFYLVCMNAYKRLDFKALKEDLNAKKKLSFGTAEQLKHHMDLSPGSVSIFGMIHAKNVKLIIDEELWRAKKVGFHPNLNTSTLEVTHENLEKFINSLKTKIRILKLK